MHRAAFRLKQLYACRSSRLLERHRRQIAVGPCTCCINQYRSMQQSARKKLLLLQQPMLLCCAAAAFCCGNATAAAAAVGHRRRLEPSGGTSLRRRCKTSQKRFLQRSNGQFFARYHVLAVWQSPDSQSGLCRLQARRIGAVPGGIRHSVIFFSCSLTAPLEAVVQPAGLGFLPNPATIELSSVILTA